LAKQRVFAAQDAKVKIFLPPFFTPHLGQAMRMWEDCVNDAQTMVARHPADFVLYELGTFDDDTGILTALSPIVRIASALEVVKKPQEPLPMSSLKQL